MVENIGNGRGFEPGIVGIENSPDHRHGEMAFQQLGNIRGQHSNRITFAKPPAGKGRGQLAAACFGLPPVAADRSVDDSRFSG